MGLSTDQWRALVRPHFEFLEDHGFRATDADDSSPWVTWVQYRFSRAAIKISRNVELNRAEVHLVRLVDGIVPEYPIWITSERIDWALLDTVLEARRSTLLGDTKQLSGLGEHDLDRQLAFWANALRTVAADFLEGDLTAIDDAGAVVKERVRQNPQQLVSYLPSDAPPEAETDVTTELAGEVPPEVSVIVRRYQRGRASDQ